VRVRRARRGSESTVTFVHGREENAPGPPFLALCLEVCGDGGKSFFVVYWQFSHAATQLLDHLHLDPSLLDEVAALAAANHGSAALQVHVASQSTHKTRRHTAHVTHQRSGLSHPCHTTKEENKQITMCAFFTARTSSTKPRHCKGFRCYNDVRHPGSFHPTGLST
jgi:hypothetical protein